MFTLSSILLLRSSLVILLLGQLLDAASIACQTGSTGEPKDIKEIDLSNYVDGDVSSIVELLKSLNVPQASTQLNSKTDGAKFSVSNGPDFPPNAASFNLTIPTGLTVKHLGVGIGTQNYSCSSEDGKLAWKPTGAMAGLWDLTHTKDDPRVIAKNAVQNKAEFVLAPYAQLALHYFVPGKTSGVPGFFFIQSSDDYVLVKKMGQMPAPENPNINVPWLSLKQTEGKAAQVVFRTHTNAGVAPRASTCTEIGMESYMKYSALYWFYG